MLWLRAADAAPPAGDADAVTTWPDASGRGHGAHVVPYPPGLDRSAVHPDRRPRYVSSTEGVGGRPAVSFDGRDDLLGIDDAGELNLGGPWAERTVFVVIRTGPDVERRQMVFESGGDLRGFNIYIDGGYLYLGAYNAWNDDRGSTTPFGPLTVSTSIEPQRAYVVTLEFDQPRGRLTGYLDGERFGAAAGVGLVFVHHEDIGIGAINEDTYYHDGVRQGVPTGDFFGGALAELLLYNEVLTPKDRAAAHAYLLHAYGLPAPDAARSAGGTAGASASAAVERLYVASGLTDRVLRLDPADGALRRSLPTERRRDEVDEPHGVAVSPDGRHVYVTVAHGEPSLWKYESHGDRLVGRIALPTAGAARIGLTPDGTRAFVPDYDRARPGSRGRVAVVSLQDLELVDAPEVCAGPHHAAVDAAGALVAIACSLGDEIVILDARTLAERARLAVGESPGLPGRPRYRPLNLAWSPDGEILYVGLYAAAAVTALRLDGTITGRVAVGDRPAQIALTPDGRTLVVANRGDASVSLIDTGAMVERARVPLGFEHPHGVAVDATGRRAFVACEGTTASPGRAVAIELATGRILWSVDVGAYALGVAFAPARTG